MPVSGIALADTLQTTWINLVDFILCVCVCALQITFGIFVGVYFDCNVALGEQNVHATSHLLYSHM